MDLLLLGVQWMLVSLVCVVRGSEVKYALSSSRWRCSTRGLFECVLFLL